MGLDMFAYVTTEAVPPVDFSEPNNAVEIAYWRKHPNLHGWMEQLYVAKGGSELFNCVPVRLDMEDIDALEKAVRGDQLPETAGFFFGESRPEDTADDLKFIAAAREALARGDTVYYSSWW